MANEFAGKKLLILGGNPETIPIVKKAKEMGATVLLTSQRETDAAKAYADKSFNVDGMDVSGVIALAREEKVDGVLVGVADILVPSYCKVCDALNLPCYATQQIVDVFSYKDVFKATFERYGVHGIPEYFVDESFKREDLDLIEYPVMVKPVDNGGGVGMTVVYKEEDLKEAVQKALSASRSKRFIVEKYMDCDDVGIYYTFKDGECSMSCIFDRYTCTEQKGVSRVSMGGIYPSKHIEDYYARMHNDALRVFKNIGIKNGVLLLQAYYENGEFYVYDTGFRLQGEAPHILIKRIHGIDQIEMLVRFALTGSEGNFKLMENDNPYFKGKSAATLWFLLKEGVVKNIKGLENIEQDPCVVFNGQRIFEGNTVPPEWIGNEKQVMTRLFLVCDSKEQLKEKIAYYQKTVSATDEKGNNMILKGFDVGRI